MPIYNIRVKAIKFLVGKLRANLHDFLIQGFLGLVVKILKIYTKF